MAGSTFNPIRDIDRFFSEVTRTPNAVGLPMDLFRDGEMFVARIDMPGVDPSSIDVDVEDRTLTVRAERTTLDPEPEVKWLTRERPTRRRCRQLTLGNRVAVDQISAEYADGVLSLTIPSPTMRSRGRSPWRTRTARARTRSSPRSSHRSPRQPPATPRRNSEPHGHTAAQTYRRSGQTHSDSGTLPPGDRRRTDASCVRPLSCVLPRS